MSNELRKVIRDGKVAVLYSPGFGAGWYTWNTGYPQAMFLPEIVELVEARRHDEITDELVKELLGCADFYAGGAGELPPPTPPPPQDPQTKRTPQTFVVQSLPKRFLKL